MNFWIFSIKYSSIPIFAAMYAVNVTSPAQLPLVSGCRNSGGKCIGGLGAKINQLINRHLCEITRGPPPLYRDIQAFQPFELFQKLPALLGPFVSA